MVAILVVALIVLVLALGVSFMVQKGKPVQVKDVVAYQSELEEMIHFCKRQVEVGVQPEHTRYWPVLPTHAKQKVHGYANDRYQYALRGHIR